MTDAPWSRRARVAALILGVAALVAATGWWWIVFRQLVLAEYISVPRALPCMVAQSPLCRLAQALCGSDHVLGIRRYSVGLFWTGGGLVLASAATSILARRADAAAACR